MPDNPSGQLTLEHGIGALRWWVTVCRRDQAPAGDMALTETLVPLFSTWANIQPSYESTFIQSTQIDGPITHMVTIRWRRYPVNAEVVIRTTKNPDGTFWAEPYRVRRSKEVGGRKRYIQMSCELERCRTVPDNSIDTYNALLTEPYDGAAAAPPGTVPSV